MDVVDAAAPGPCVALHPSFNGPEGRSFPSGHASVAFYLASPWFLLRSTRRRAARLWLGAGLAYGGLVSLTRMVQGAHFLSDVLWSWGIVHLLGLLLAHWLRLDHSEVPLPFPARPASASIRPTFVGWVRAWPAVLQALRVRAAAAVSRLCAAGARGSRDPQTDPAATQIRHFLVKGAVSSLCSPLSAAMSICRAWPGHSRPSRRRRVAALALQLASNCVAAGRWHLIMHRLGVPGSFAFYLQSFFKGALFNQGLPSSIGGDGLRILDVARLAGRREDAVFGVFIDRFVGLAGLVLLNLAALLVNPTLLPHRVALPLLACLSLLTVVLAGLFLLGRIDLFQRGRILPAFSDGSPPAAARCAPQPPALTLRAGLSILTHMLAMAHFAVLGHAAGLHYPCRSTWRWCRRRCCSPSCPCPWPAGACAKGHGRPVSPRRGGQVDGAHVFHRL